VREGLVYAICISSVVCPVLGLRSVRIWG
jgi:hypothetical protein